MKVENAIRNAREYASELKDTNDSLLNTKQNQITQILTVVAFIALPLSIITSLLQIDMRSRPIVGIENDFWIVLGALVIIGFGLFLYFKKKKWL